MSSIARIQHIPAYVGELRSKTGYYIGYIPNEYADRVDKDNFYEVVRKDGEIARCIHLLSLMSAGEMIVIESRDDGLKEIVSFAMNQISDFMHARKSLVEKAVLFGLGIQRKYYKKIEKWGMVWDVVERLQEVDRRRLRLERDEEDKNHLYWTMWCPKIDQYIILEDLAQNPLAASGTAVQDYLWFMHMQEELSPYFEGFGDVLYHLVFIKSKVIQYWADLCESWAKPFMTIMIDLAKNMIDANLGPGFVSNAQRIADLLSTFEKTRSKHIAVLDSSDKIDFHEHGSTGQNILRELLDYCDQKISLLLLGAELTTTTPGAGSYKLGVVHKEATDTIILYNRKRLEEVLNKDLLFDFLIRNRMNLAAMGLKIPEVGEIKIKIKMDMEEIAEMNAAQQGQQPGQQPGQQLGQQGGQQPGQQGGQ